MNKIIIVATGAAALVALTVIALKSEPTGPESSGADASLSSGAVTSGSPLSSSNGAKNSSSAAGATSRLPDSAATQAMPPEVELWRLNEESPDTVMDGHPAKHLHSDPELVGQFHVGQTLHLAIPQSGQEIEARINSTHNQSSKVHIFRAEIVGSGGPGNVVVARGNIATHVTISTPESTYSAVIDNASGETVLVDESDVTANQLPFDDGIPVPPIEQDPPPFD